jgi:predicted RND superfamily exporter protein
MPHEVDLSHKRANRKVIESITGTLGNTLAWWVNGVRRLASWLLGAAILVTGALLYYGVSNLGINTDTADMLSEILHFRHLHTDCKRTFPQYEDTLLIVVDEDTPDLAQDSSLVLVDCLKGERVLKPSSTVNSLFITFSDGIHK